MNTTRQTIRTIAKRLKRSVPHIYSIGDASEYLITHHLSIDECIEMAQKDGFMPNREGYLSLYVFLQSYALYLKKDMQRASYQILKKALQFGIVTLESIFEDIDGSDWMFEEMRLMGMT